MYYNSLSDLCSLKNKNIGVWLSRNLQWKTVFSIMCKDLKYRIIVSFLNNVSVHLLTMQYLLIHAHQN